MCSTQGSVAHLLVMLSSAFLYTLLCPRLDFLRAAETVAVYQEARIQSHNIVGVVREVHSYWTGSGYLLLPNVSLFGGMDGSD